MSYSTRVTHPTNRPNYCEVTHFTPTATLTVAYSYETPIGFQCSAYEGGTIFTRRNDWGPTTARHMYEWSRGRGDQGRGGSGPRGFLSLLAEAYEAANADRTEVAR